MAIKGTENMTVDEINQAINEGGRFVVYQYCFSVMVMTFKRNSDIQFVKPGEKRQFATLLLLTLVSLFFGWWGIPWGPIYTIQTIANNLTGGKDVTAEVIARSNEVSRD